MRNRRQNDYVSLEVCISWLGCLITTTNPRRRGYILKTRAWPLPRWTEICHTKHENEGRSLALLGKHDQAHLEQHSNSSASSGAMSPGRCHVLVSVLPPAPLPATKSPFLLMRNQTKQAQPLIPKTYLLTQALYMVTAAAALPITASQSPCAFLCLKCFLLIPQGKKRRN